MVNDPAMRASDAPHRTFIKVPGNGMGVALSFGKGYVYMGIREETSQGDILVFESADSLNTFIAYLFDAGKHAFDKEQSNDANR